MEMKHELTLYTQPNCMYCDMMKAKLNEWGYKYNVKNIQEDDAAKAFIVLDRGHRTVPQLHYGRMNINHGVNTEDFTQSILEQYIGHLDEIK
jgi:glutaredoxin